MASIKWLLGPVLAFWIWFGIPPSALGELGANAHTLLGVLAWVISWWIFEPVPLPVTSFLGVALAILLGIEKDQAALSGFANPVIFLFLGGFFLAEALTAHQADKRIALFLLTRKWIAGKPKRTLFALFTVTAFISMWLSNTATAAIMLPIAISLLPEIAPDNQSDQGVILISIAYCSSIGGMATPVGTPPNALAIGFLQSQAGISLGFLEWMKLAMPAMLLILVVHLVLAFYLLKKLPARLNSQQLNTQYRSLGRLTRGEKNTFFAFSICIFLWIAPDLLTLFLPKGTPFIETVQSHIPLSAAAILGSGLLFVLPTEKGEPTLTWKRAARIDWGTLLLFGGGVCLGNMMKSTGLDQWIGQGILSLTGGHFWAFVAIAIGVSVLLSEVASNTAATNMLLPMAIAAAQSGGNSPVISALAVTLGCSLGFMLPVATPPNAIVYGTGRVRTRQMLVMGAYLNGVGAVAVFLTLYLANFLY